MRLHPIHLWLKSQLELALAQAYPEAADQFIEVAPSKNPTFGDYQTNLALVLTKKLKIPPMTIAESVCEAVKTSPGDVEFSVTKPGFINAKISSKLLTQAFLQLEADPRLGVPKEEKPTPVIIDFSSPNVAKRMHIGHIRSTILGHAIAEIYRFLGYDVVTDNHFGDWGTQFGKLLYGYRHFLDQAQMEDHPLDEMERLYVLVSDKEKTDPDMAAEARQELVRLQQGDSENRRLWEEMVEVSKREFNRIYARLSIRFDSELGESFYNDQLPDVVKQLENAGLAEESEGAKVVRFPDHPALEDKPFIIQKADGGFNYATTDVATILYRLKTYPAVSRIVYVVDQRQSLHFQQLFETMTRLLQPAAELVHVDFGMIQLRNDDGSISTLKTRDGNVIRLDEFLDEAYERALEVVKVQSIVKDEQQQQQIAEVIGMGAVKYADLSQNRVTNIVFSWDKALALDGNTAPYLIYTYARIKSLLAKAEEAGHTFDTETEVAFDGEYERPIVLQLFRLSDAVRRAADSYRPNLVADYVFELASTYNTSFQNAPVLRAETESLRQARLRLAQLVAKTIKLCLSCLGIQTVERM